MNSLELKRKKLELSRVSLAREEQEFKVDEFKEQIKRLEANILIQKTKENELLVEINKLEKRN